MKRFALWVQFDIKPGMLEAFLEEARLDAEGSVSNERGCYRFDVLQDSAVENRVCFYEVYTDEAAFLEHREMPHFKKYLAATASMIETRSATRMTVVQRGKP